MMNRLPQTKFSAVVLVLIVLISSANARVFRPGDDVVFHDRSFLTQDESRAAVRTEDGLLFIWNRRDLNFTLLIKGQDIRPMNDPNNIFLTVDGRVLQIQSLPISNFAADARKNKLDDKAILAAHRDWETKFLEDELLHSKVAIQSSSEKLTSGTEALVWQYDLPEKFKNPDAKTQMYLGIVAKDYIILLNGVVSASSSEAEVRKFLVGIMTTLKVSSEPIDVKKLQDAIRKGDKP